MTGRALHELLLSEVLVMHILSVVLEVLHVSPVKTTNSQAHNNTLKATLLRWELNHYNKSLIETKRTWYTVWCKITQNC